VTTCSADDSYGLLTLRNSTARRFSHVKTTRRHRWISPQIQSSQHSYSLRETRFEIPVDIQYRLQYAVPGFDLTKMLSETGAFFNRAEELAMLQGLLGATPTAVVLLTGPPSCGKSGVCSAEWTVTLASPDSWTGLQRC